MGMGPMTGRGAGYCAGYNMPGTMNRWSWRRWGFAGRGGGPGRGFGWRYWAQAPPFFGRETGVPMSPDQEADYLHSEAEALSRQLEGIQKRISELKSEQKSK